MKKLKKCFIIVGTAVAVVLLCVLTAFAVRDYDKSHLEKVEVVKEVEVPVEHIVEKEAEISGEVIESGLHNIGKLCTAEYYYTHVEHYDSSKKFHDFEIPFTSSSFIYSYEGKVLAGIDFERITIEKDEAAKSIVVGIPHAEIVSSDVDQDSFELYDEKNSVFNPIEVKDVTDSFADLKNSEEKKAVDNGLLERAEENATRLIENLIRGSYKAVDYEIKIEFSEDAPQE